MIRDQNGDFVGSSIPLNFKGTFDVYEKSFLGHSIARHSVDTHFCLVPGCNDHSSKPQKIHLICACLICVIFRNRLVPIYPVSYITRLSLCG